MASWCDRSSDNFYLAKLRGRVCATACFSVSATSPRHLARLISGRCVGAAPADGRDLAPVAQQGHGPTDCHSRYPVLLGEFHLGRQPRTRTKAPRIGGIGL